MTGYAFTPSTLAVSTTTSSADFSAVSCNYNGVPAAISADPLGSSDGLSVSVSAGCPWTAVSNASWLTIAPSTASGVGPIAVSFSYAANHGLARTTTITIATKTVAVSQASAGNVTLGPLGAAVFLNGRWTIDKNANGVFDSGDPYFTFQIYGTGDKPVVGDWDGSGVQKVGVFNNGFWALDYNGNGQWDGPVIDRFYALGGISGEVPVVGDWNGDGRTKIGTFLNGRWALDYNGNGQWDGAVTDRYVIYSLGGAEKPVVGDWTGSGTTKIGSFRDGFWVLDTNGSFAYETSDSFCGIGGAGDVPVVGDWNGDGRSKIGVFRNGFWLLDSNGNCRWDGIGSGNDRFVALGGNAGEIPVPGKWQ